MDKYTVLEQDSESRATHAAVGALIPGLRSNSLPRSGRTLPQQPSLRPGLSTVASGLIDQEDSDGALSAPELPAIRRDRGKTLSLTHTRTYTHPHNLSYTMCLYIYTYTYIYIERNFDAPISVVERRSRGIWLANLYGIRRICDRRGQAAVQVVFEMPSITQNFRLVCTCVREKMKTQRFSMYSICTYIYIELYIPLMHGIVGLHSLQSSFNDACLII